MTLDWAFISYAAIGTVDGQLSALGIGSDTFLTPGNPVPSVTGNMPVVRAQIPITVVARFAAEPLESGQSHEARLEILDDASTIIAFAVMPVVVPPINPGMPKGWPIVVNVIAPMALPIFRFGEYTAIILLDNINLKKLPFRVLQQGQPVVAAR